MNARDNLILIVLLSISVCTVFGRNVENARQKRTSENSCDNVQPFFQSRNISVQQHDSPKGSICGGQCCGPAAEAVLRKEGQEVFATMLRHNSRSWQGLLNSTATTLQSHVTELAELSENKTLQLFSKVYREMSAQSYDAINGLYTDIQRYIQINSSQDAFTNTNINIVASVSRFFTDMFPLMYHRILKTPTKDFSFEYKLCLKETMSEIQPFGDIPRQVSQSLAKSLDAARLLLQAFSVGVEVLNATDTLIIADDGKSNVECHDALMKMTHCPKCIGLRAETKPCSGYCLNVLRGCLTRYVAELDAPWNGYVEGIERLVSAMKQHNNEAGVNVDAVIRNLHTRISEAIMHAMENEATIDMKVKKACGAYALSDKEEPSLVDGGIDGGSSGTSSGEMGLAGKQSQQRTAPVRQFTPPPEPQMSHFLISIGKSRGFYGTLADNLCQDESFAETKDQHCWNGERIGEYTKTVVDASLDMQRYNPEVKPSLNLQNVDSRVANLADKLRHVHQMVMSSLGAVGLPESDNYMQGDGADGSGSGAGPNFNGYDDDDGVQSSGSGGGSLYGKDVDIPEITGRDPGPTEAPASSAEMHYVCYTTLLLFIPNLVLLRIV